MTKLSKYFPCNGLPESLVRKMIELEEGVPAEDIVLLHGFSQLLDSWTPEPEMNLYMTLRLDGGKKKRKKKVYTKPKKIKHKHVARPKACLNYFKVDGDKITRLKMECEKCPASTYMAEHADRHHCGKCGFMLYKLDKNGNRLPPPVQKKVAKVVEKAAPAKAAAKGKKKK